MALTRVLVLGGTGTLGHKMFQVLSKHQVLSRHLEVFATSRCPRVSHPVYDDVNPKYLVTGVSAMRFDTVVRAFASVRPSVVLNCIGAVQRPGISVDPLTSIALNALFPHRLADLCAVAGVYLIHVSTDGVFSGEKGNYTEKDTPDPIGLYGRTKLLGELYRRDCLTLRVSFIGRDHRRDTLLEWFLDNRGGKVLGYTGVVFSGLTTLALARAVGELIVRLPTHSLSGLYHLSGESISKHDLLVRLRQAMSLDVEIEPNGDLHRDRSLDSTRLRAKVDLHIPTWDEMITDLVEDATPYGEWRECHAVA